MFTAKFIHNYWGEIGFQPILTLYTSHMLFAPMNLYASIPMGTLNLFAGANYPHPWGSTSVTHTYYMGIYTLTGSTLTLINYFSRTVRGADNIGSNLSLGNVSQASTLIPGTYFFCLRWASSCSLTSLTSGTTRNNIQLYRALPMYYGTSPSYFLGGFTTTTASGGLIASIATTDLEKVNNGTNPYATDRLLIMLSA